MEKLELLVVVDPLRPPGRRSPSARTAPTCCRAARSSRAAARAPLEPLAAVVRARWSSRSSRRRTTTRSCISSPRSSASTKEMFKNIKVENNLPVAEDILREINRGGLSTGYCGQSPERLKAAHGEPEGLRPGDAAGQGRPGQGRLLRPAVAVLGHAGDQASRHPHALQPPPARHGRRRHLPRPLRRRARGQGRSWRTASRSRRTSQHNLLAEGSYSVGSEIQDGYPRVHLCACSRSSAGTRT